MPWDKPEQSLKHTKKAVTPELQNLWIETANRVREETGSDASAIRAANSAVKHFGDKKEPSVTIGHGSRIK